MDFYETSACTNQNIKEVRLSSTWTWWESPERGELRRPCGVGLPLGQMLPGCSELEETGLTCALGPPVFHAANGAGAAGPSQGAGGGPDTGQQ